MEKHRYHFKPEEVWFTSDTHFGYENIIRFCGRPFKNAKEMNAELIRRWQETVPEDGIVFHLGDFAHGGTKLWNSILSTLPGHKYLILGNHDMKVLRHNYIDRFEIITQQMSIRIGEQAIILNHNPFLCYGGSYNNVWQLFGHVHSGPITHTGLDHPRLRMLFPLQYDVGVDNNDFRPVSFTEVKEKIDAQVSSLKAIIGIRDKSPSPGSRKIIFLDSGTRIGPDEMASLKTAAPEIIEVESSDPTSIKETIARYVSVIAGNVRYVYIGSCRLDDFRHIHVESGTAITPTVVKEALNLL